MKRTRFAILFFIAFIGYGEKSFSQYRCPTTVGHATFCQSAGSSFFMYGAPPDPQVTSAEIKFEGGDPSCNTIISLAILFCNQPGYFYADNVAPYCQDLSPTGTVLFNTGMECVYKDGDLVPCNDLVTKCKEPLIELAQDFVTTPQDCKVWEGPCTTESEIWRTGKVIIGADLSPSEGYMLSVRGGIATEMLQICKAEWCDYVFSDTFELMPLEDMKNYLALHGHLSGCTPGAVIEKEGGFLLEEEVVNQQKKIEEIFLHLINAQHRLDALSNKLIATPLAQVGPAKYLGDEYDEVTTQSLIECFQIKPAPNGIGGIVVTPDSGPYSVSWSGAGNGNMIHVVCNGAIRISNLSAGNYIVTVSNAAGLIGTCNFSISSGGGEPLNCAIISDPVCNEAILNMLEEGFNTTPDCIQWEGDPCSHEGEIYRLGNVEIGTSVGRAGFSLAVKGGIVTDKFRVELCESEGWCDYVFEDDYPLPSLYEVESFIKKNRHLPGTITQNEVTQNDGFEVRSVKLDHQKKIEEAYLHLIALDKKKKELQQRFSILSEQN